MPIETPESLAKRLDTGWEMIEQAKEKPAVKKRLEDHWFKMLRAYEAACDRVREIDDEDERDR